MNWDDLTIREKAQVIHSGVQNGINRVSDIKKAYNEFADGGEMDKKQGIIDWLSDLFSFNSTSPSDSIQNTADTINTSPLDLNELKLRQAYAESRFDTTAKSPVGARGVFQIMPSVLDEYNKYNGSSYKISDLDDSTLNAQIRDWYMQKLAERSWVTKGGASDSVQYGKQLAAYNYGPTNTVKALEEAKKDNIDIYSGWDWLSKLPKETQDYVNFILRNKNSGVVRNNVLYDISKKAHKDVVNDISYSIGGPLYPFSFQRNLPNVRY